MDDGITVSRLDPDGFRAWAATTFAPPQEDGRRGGFAFGFLALALAVLLGVGILVGVKGLNAFGEFGDFGLAALIVWAVATAAQPIS